MRILVVERNKQPYVKDIENTLRAKQQVVGGPIDVINPYDGSLAIVLNDEGKNMGLKINRTIGNIEIAGTFFLCREDSEGNLLSLSEIQINQLMQKFSLS